MVMSQYCYGCAERRYSCIGKCLSANTETSDIHLHHPVFNLSTPEKSRTLD
jgi:hypothetical protein